MSQFGGATQFGEDQFGGDPFGLDPAYACERMVDALSAFQLTASGGSVATIATLTGPPDDMEAIAKQVQGGLPAILVGYAGGSFLPVTASQDQFEQRVTFPIVCVADSLRTRLERLAGRNVYKPGLWNLTRWALFYCTRAMSAVGSVRQVQPLSERFIRYGAESFVGIVELEAVQTVNIYEDAVSLKLERLGIVHTPSDKTQLFEADNVTPNTDDPTGAGVATL